MGDKVMPISQYYGGKGDQVMGGMEKTYGDPKKAKAVFYATLNKRANEGNKIAGPLPRRSKDKLSVMRSLNGRY